MEQASRGRINEVSLERTMMQLIVVQKDVGKNIVHLILQNIPGRIRMGTQMI